MNWAGHHECREMQSGLPLGGALGSGGSIADACSVPVALTIAGSDSGGGAGIQADLKTFQELGVYGTSALTAITAQNTLGVQGVLPVAAEQVGMQMDSVAADLPPDAVKTGMLFSGEVIETVAERAVRYGWKKLVVDPVITAKGGARLLREEALEALRRQLLPLALAVTPNVPEAELLAGFPIRSFADRERAAAAIHSLGSRFVILKGGHAEEDRDRAVDLVYDGSGFLRLESPRIATRHTHGTGCTFSAALAAELARGASVPEAAAAAKAFVQAAIEDGLGLGSGHGPTNHFAYKRRMARRESGEHV
ncbi:bifunctional hydroxymethylpyrimidine kinase/phosphomethylpyrimidine kinase [Paenibacillus spiritus]|nr:bifunctional hydroxymethylpyrimidine kinase/phosphomethylpyrimidine kinase [Paenibacillus spiritus]